MQGGTSFGSLLYTKNYKALHIIGCRGVLFKHLTTFFFLNIRKQKRKKLKPQFRFAFQTLRCCLWSSDPGHHENSGTEETLLLVSVFLDSEWRWACSCLLELISSASTSRQTPVPLTMARVFPTSYISLSQRKCIPNTFSTGVLEENWNSGSYCGPW